MKFLLLIFSLLTFPLFSQNIIWSETFESYTDGTQNAPNGKWTTSAGNCDGEGSAGTIIDQNYWGVRTTSGNKEFLCNDIEGLTCCTTGQTDTGLNDNYWLSENINISGYSQISIFMEARVVGNVENCNYTCGVIIGGASRNGGDHLESSYSIDGGPWIPFLEICGANSGSTFIECIDVGSGNTLRIKVELGNQANTEKYYFDDIYVYEASCSVVLPIELISFNGHHNYENGFNELQWITASEINNDRFEVYSSNDGLDWELISIVNGSGNSTTQQTYNYEHRTISELSYYKLKQVDYDGEFTYSDIISINKDNKILDIKYYDILGKEIPAEPSTGIFIKVIQYQYKTEYLRIFKD